MSQLSDAIEGITNEQFERHRIVCQLDADDDVSIVEYSGIDVVVVAPGEEAAVIARISWGAGDVAADLQVFLAGELQAHETMALDGTTSVWATRP